MKQLMWRGQRGKKALGFILAVALIVGLFAAAPPARAHATSSTNVIDVSDPETPAGTTDWSYSTQQKEFVISNAAVGPLEITGTTNASVIRVAARATAPAAPLNITLSGLNVDYYAGDVGFPALEIGVNNRVNLLLDGTNTIRTSFSGIDGIKIASGSSIDAVVTIGGVGLLNAVGVMDTSGNGHGVNGPFVMDGDVIVSASSFNRDPDFVDPKGVTLANDPGIEFLATVYGDVKLPVDLTIPGNQSQGGLLFIYGPDYDSSDNPRAKLTIPNGRTLRNENQVLASYGDLVIESGGAFINENMIAGYSNIRTEPGGKLNGIDFTVKGGLPEDSQQRDDAYAWTVFDSVDGDGEDNLFLGAGMTIQLTESTPPAREDYIFEFPLYAGEAEPGKADHLTVAGVRGVNYDRLRLTTSMNANTGSSYLTIQDLNLTDIDSGSGGGPLVRFQTDKEDTLAYKGANKLLVHGRLPDADDGMSIRSQTDLTVKPADSNATLAANEIFANDNGLKQVYISGGNVRKINSTTVSDASIKNYKSGAEVYRVAVKGAFKAGDVVMAQVPGASAYDPYDYLSPVVEDGGVAYLWLPLGETTISVKNRAGFSVQSFEVTDSATANTLTLVKDINASGVTVAPLPAQTYTGEAITPAITVRDGDKLLALNKDYTVNYDNNTAVGTAIVTIAGKDHYTGSRIATFRITPLSVASVAITGAPAKLSYKASGENRTLRLNATVLPQNATNKGVKWESSNTSIARVDADGLVEFTGKEGAVKITATSTNDPKKSDAKTIEVVKNVTAVRTPLSTVYLQRGKSLTLPIALEDSSAPKVKISSKLTWKSAKKSVLKVTQRGKITASQKAKKNAKVKVTVAAANGKSKTINVVIVPKAVKVKKISVKFPKSIKANKTYQLKVGVGKATGVKVTFKSSKSSVLKVDASGKLFAGKKGAATITIKAGNKSVKKTIKVT